MLFNLCLIDPTGAKYSHFLFDPIRAMQLALESLGHNTSITRNNIDRERIPLLLGAHHVHDDSSLALILQLPQYVVVQTEVLDGFEVNGSYGQEHFRKYYLPLLRGATRVWDWSEKNLTMLRGFGVRGDRIELGFHPDLLDVHHKKEKDIDVLWYGSQTPYRTFILKAIRGLGLRTLVLFDDPPIYRNDAMARARIVLSLQQSAGAHINAARVIHAVNNRCLVVGEKPIVPHWIEDAMISLPAAELIAQLPEIARRADLDAIVQEKYEALSRFPTTAFLAPLVERLDAEIRSGKKEFP